MNLNSAFPGKIRAVRNWITLVLARFGGKYDCFPAKESFLFQVSELTATKPTVDHIESILAELWWAQPDSNRRPSACEANVITTRP